MLHRRKLSFKLFFWFGWKTLSFCSVLFSFKHFSLAFHSLLSLSLRRSRLSLSVSITRLNLRLKELSWWFSSWHLIPTRFFLDKWIWISCLRDRIKLGLITQFRGVLNTVYLNQYCAIVRGRITKCLLRFSGFCFYGVSCLLTGFWWCRFKVKSNIVRSWCHVLAERLIHLLFYFLSLI